jgi:hypothetical protein
VSAERQLSVAAATNSEAVLAQTQSQSNRLECEDMGENHDLTLQRVSEVSDAAESQMDVPTFSAQVKCGLEAGASGPVGFEHMTVSYGKHSISNGVSVEREPEKHGSAGPASFSSCLGHARKKEASYRVHRPFVEAIRSSMVNNESASEAAAPLGTFVSMDGAILNNGDTMTSLAEKYRTLQHNGHASNSFGAAAFTLSTGTPARPPDFTSASRSIPVLGFGSQPHTNNSLNRPAILNASLSTVPSAPALNTNIGLSGLDMLAAVSNQHELRTSMSEASNIAHPAPIAVQQNGYRHSFLQSDPSQALTLLQQHLGLQQKQMDQSFGPNSTNSGSSSSYQYGW